MPSAGQQTVELPSGGDLPRPRTRAAPVVRTGELAHARGRLAGPGVPNSIRSRLAPHLQIHIGASVDRAEGDFLAGPWCPAGRANDDHIAVGEPSNNVFTHGCPSPPAV